MKVWVVTYAFHVPYSPVHLQCIHLNICIQLLLSLLMTVYDWTIIDSFISHGEGTAFNFSLGFKSLPICIGHNNICILIKGKYGLVFFKIPELVIK